ncbi:hypothetical protein ACFV9E_44485, partial [Streptomyces sp. NPDC059835]
MVLRTLTMAAAAAALLVPGAQPHVAAAERAAVPEVPAAGRWTARAAESFWTPARRASAVPLPADPGPGTAGDATPGTAPAPTPGTGTGPGLPAAAPDATPGAAPATTPAPALDPDPELPPVPDVDPLPDGVPDADVDPDDKAVNPPPILDTASPRLPAAGPGVGQDFQGTPVVGRMSLVKGGGAY